MIYKVCSTVQRKLFKAIYIKQPILTAWDFYTELCKKYIVCILNNMKIVLNIKYTHIQHKKNTQTNHLLLAQLRAVITNSVYDWVIFIKLSEYSIESEERISKY